MSGHPGSSHHVVPPWIYLLVFLALLVGTFLTVEAARHDFGAWNTPVAMAIAVTKATLVVLFFMHVKYSSRLTWLIVGGAFVWLAIMLIITVSDYWSRGWLGSPGT
jgi:cytochrome c oxidase subunit 4